MGTVAIVIEKLRDGGNGDCSDYSLAPLQTTPGTSSDHPWPLLARLCRLPLDIPQGGACYCKDARTKGTQELRRGIEAGGSWKGK